MLLHRCHGTQRALTSAPESGFERVQAGRSLLIVDAGRAPPPGLDLASHAGALSFEFSVGRERLLVNCGARGWDPDWAGALRATAAHNTLSIDEVNSAELLPHGGFGRQPDQVTCRREEREGHCLLELSHDGYLDRFGLLHRRQLYLSPGGDDLRGEDSIEAGEEGLPAHRFRSAFTCTRFAGSAWPWAAIMFW